MAVASTTTAALLSSSLARSRRTLSCSAAGASAAQRIAPQPPDLLRWVQREGGFVHPALRVVDHPEDGLGVSAAAAEGDIPPADVLIALPGRLPLCLRRPAGAADAVLTQPADQVPERVALQIQSCGKHVTEELWTMRLGLRLLQERAKSDSFWWPYIANLPETFTVPIFFPGKTKNTQYAPLLHQVNKRCHFLLKFEKEVKHKLDTVPLENHPFCGQDVNSSSLGWAMIVQEGNVDSTDMSVKVVAETKIDQNAAVTVNYGCYPSAVAWARRQTRNGFSMLL